MGNLTGQKLGKYELAERIAQGGMAEVYKAFQPGVDRWVVVKVLHCHLAESQDFVARFQREARAVGCLHHPHIIHIIDAGVEQDNHYIVMDYIAGGTLGDALKERTPLPVAEALALTVPLAEALAYAHRQGVIHRDIKPNNILFAGEGRQHPVLTDFGLARIGHETAGGLTPAGELVGTPTYMSPEAVRGEATDARTDVYSLGVVLYESLTGRAPYVANTPYSMLMQQANEPLPLPRSLNPALPPALEALLLRALAKAPAERYPDAAAFARALRQVQHGLLDATQPARGQEKRSPLSAGRQPTPARPVAAPAARLEGAPAKAAMHKSPAGNRALGFASAATAVTLVTLLATYVLMHLA